MKFWIGLGGMMLGGAVLLAPVARRGPTTGQEQATQIVRPEGARTPVLVELFTSEGCSSCPPADALIARLDKSQPVAGAEIIALKEHVDYWNHQGWRDPFSAAQFSKRQNAYASALGSHQVYTPQMVVDGRAEFVGSSEYEARQAIAAAARAVKLPIHLEWAPRAAAESISLQVRVDAAGQLPRDDAAEVLLAITEDGLHSDVLRGENAGRKFEHYAVVRELKRIGSIPAQSPAAFTSQPNVALDKAWKRENLRAVVFVQEVRSRRVLGAASLRVPVN